MDTLTVAHRDNAAMGAAARRGTPVTVAPSARRHGDFIVIRFLAYAVGDVSAEAHS
jgi:hypothetical protein